MASTIRTFETGATRDTDTNKLDYEGFLSPLVLARYAQYMHKNRFRDNGEVRDSDNWQLGIPKEAYMKSGFRHFMEWWSQHRYPDGGPEFLEEALCALMFNVQGYLLTLLQETEKGRIWEASTLDPEFTRDLEEAFYDPDPQPSEWAALFEGVKLIEPASVQELPISTDWALTHPVLPQN